MRITVAITGASGSIYAQRLIDRLVACDEVEQVFVIFSTAGRQVYAIEVGSAIASSLKITEFAVDDLFAPIASGSSPADVMVIVPCSMGTMARIANGVSSNLIERAADVQLKEGARLIVVARETPLSLIHLRAMTTLCQAGAMILPACPSFYSKPHTIEDVADTVVERILDKIGVDGEKNYRWGAK